MHGSSSALVRALVGYWNLDEGNGNIAWDRSTHENDGLLLGEPVWIRPGFQLALPK